MGVWASASTSATLCLCTRFHDKAGASEVAERE